MSKSIKKFDKYLEEVSIKGNPGIPSEGSKDDNDRNYLSDIESRKSQELGGIDRRDRRDMEVGQLGFKIMNLSRKSHDLSYSKKDELEKLAKQVIIAEFGDLLEDVELIVKLVGSGSDVKDFMDQEKEESEMETPPSLEEITDPELINKIHKAKIANNIIQGESKNTKHILHSDFIKSELNRIFGEDKGKEIFEIWDEISKIADKMDWYIPIDIKSDMMRNTPEGMAGANSVSWEKKEDNDNEEEEEEKDVLKLDDIKDEDSEQEEQEDFGYTPVVKAVGIDFPMLIHEAVKGIYELIASIMLPGEGSTEQEISDAEAVKMNVTSFEDEAEDFRYGPELASDFRDFINVNSVYEKYPNIRAYVFGKMCDPNYMNESDFLRLFRGILNKTTEARRWVDRIISEIVSEFEQYEREVSEYDNEDIFSNNYDEEQDDEIEVEYPTSQEETKGGEELDYSKMNKRDLQEIIDNALDKGDYDTVSKASQFLENIIYKFKK